MPSLIFRNLRLVLQSEPDIVQPVEQAMPHEFIDWELRAKTLIVSHLALLQVNRELVIAKIAGPPHQLGCFILFGATTIVGGIQAAAG